MSKAPKTNGNAAAKKDIPLPTLKSIEKQSGVTFP
jgi:predicted RNA binding protein YcfA (HicA-like mRNA interferase family)